MKACKDDNSWFITVSLKALYNKVWIRYQCLIIFSSWFSKKGCPATNVPPPRLKGWSSDKCTPPPPRPHLDWINWHNSDTTLNLKLHYIFLGSIDGLKCRLYLYISENVGWEWRQLARRVTQTMCLNILNTQTMCLNILNTKTMCLNILKEVSE